MHLRNRKTGQVGNFIINKDHFECTDLEYVPEYRSLAELSMEWKDVSAEPLIKDEKIRNLVRAWADGNDAINVQFDAFWRGFRHNDSTITVWEDLPLEDNKIYSIAELCGKEEE